MFEFFFLRIIRYHNWQIRIFLTQTEEVLTLHMRIERNDNKIVPPYPPSSPHPCSSPTFFSFWVPLCDSGPNLWLRCFWSLYFFLFKRVKINIKKKKWTYSKYKNRNQPLPRYPAAQTTGSSALTVDSWCGRLFFFFFSQSKAKLQLYFSLDVNRHLESWFRATLTSFLIRRRAKILEYLSFRIFLVKFARYRYLLTSTHLLNGAHMSIAGWRGGYVFGSWSWRPAHLRSY